MSGRVSKLARHRRPSVARRAVTSRTLSSHHLIPSCSAAYPHHRRHLSKRAVFGSSFDAHAVIAPPRRTSGKNALRRPRIMAIITTPRPSTSATRRKTGREDSVLALLVSSLIVPRIRRRPVAYCPHGLSIPGRRQFPGRSYIPRRFPQLTTSAPYHRLIASSIPPHPSNSPPLNPGKQARQCSGRPSAPSSYSRLVSSSHRPVSPLVSACGAKGVSFLSATPRFTRLATRRHFFSVETRAGKE